MSSPARATSASHGTMSLPSVGRVAAQSEGVPMATSGMDADKELVSNREVWSFLVGFVTVRCLPCVCHWVSENKITPGITKG